MDTEHDTNSATNEGLGCTSCQALPTSREDLALVLDRCLYESSHEAYCLYRCKRCGQAYLEQFHEIINWSDGDDEVWLRWLPLSAEELTEIDRRFPVETKDHHEAPGLAALMHRRRRLTRSPGGQFFWCDTACDIGDLSPPG